MRVAGFIVMRGARYGDMPGFPIAVVTDESDIKEVIRADAIKAIEDELDDFETAGGYRATLALSYYVTGVS